VCVDEVGVLTSQLLQSADSLKGGVFAAATTQQTHKRPLELTIEHRVDDRVESAGQVSEPQEHLQRRQRQL